MAPLCGMTIFQVMWELPAAVAVQIYYVHLQVEGNILVRGQSKEELLQRLLLCPTRK